LPQDGFTIRQVARITGLSPRQLGYWRRTGLVSPATRTPGGHARYAFADLVALKTARKLLDAGVSVQRMRHCLEALTRFLPRTDRPLHELSLVVTGDVVLVLHGRGAFDALTGQEWILPVAEVLREVQEAEPPRGGPRQEELFALAEPAAPGRRGRG
jgi:DNA-binding transcriptional MerR regulator